MVLILDILRRPFQLTKRPYIYASTFQPQSVNKSSDLDLFVEVKLLHDILAHKDRVISGLKERISQLERHIAVIEATPPVIVESNTSQFIRQLSKRFDELSPSGKSHRTSRLENMIRRDYSPRSAKSIVEQLHRCLCVRESLADVNEIQANFQREKAATSTAENNCPAKGIPEYEHPSKRIVL